MTTPNTARGPRLPGRRTAAAHRPCPWAHWAGARRRHPGEDRAPAASLPLEGRPVEEVVVRRNRHPLPRPGTLVESVEARGKHLLITFEGGSVLQSHLLMTGAWILHRRGERWRDVPGAMRAVVATADHEAVLFLARPWRGSGRPGSPGSGRGSGSGPICAVLRWNSTRCCAGSTPSNPTVAAGEVLTDQHVCGRRRQRLQERDPLGLRGEPVHADRRPRQDGTAPPLRDRLGATRRQPRAVRRATYGRGVAVYGRHGQGCPRCHAALRIAEQGPAEMRRTTTWCPRCQPATAH